MGLILSLVALVGEHRDRGEPCGVSVGNDLSRNAHMFAVPEFGSTARLDWPGWQATISNARAVPIVPNWINGKHPHARVKHYATCRNWQAAWMMVTGEAAAHPPPRAADGPAVAGLQR